MKSEIFSKIKHFFSLRIPEPTATVVKVLLVLISLPILAGFCLLVFIGGYNLYDYLVYDAGLFPPDRISYLGLLFIILFSCIIILPLYWRFKRCSAISLVRLVVIILLVELIIFFWYRAWYIEYMYRNYFGGFEDFAIENRLDILIEYVKALFKTAAVSCLYFIVLSWSRFFSPKQK